MSSTQESVKQNRLKQTLYTVGFIDLCILEINTGIQININFIVSTDNWNAIYIMQTYFNYNILVIADFTVKYKILVTIW
jgi:hypothetical protein